MAKRRQNRSPRALRPTAPRSGPVRVAPEPEPTTPATIGDRLTSAAPLVVGIAALLLFIRTLQRSLPTGDSGELLTDAWVLGVAHPPGYPTFTMLTALAERLTPGNPALGGNALSAVLHALTVCLVGLAIARLPIAVFARGVVPTGRWLRWAEIGGVVAGAGLLAVSTAFWSYAIVAEVFPLNSLLAAAIVLLMLEWQRAPERVRLLWAAALCSGLALTNQQTIVLLGPGLAILYVVGLRRAARLAPSGPAAARRITRTILVPAGLGVIGLLPYLYLPIAAGGDPPMNWGDPRTLDRFLAVVLRQDYGTFRLVASEAQGNVIDHLGFLGTYFLSAFSLPGVTLGVLGFAWLLRRRSVEGWALLVMFLVSGPLFVAYANPPVDDTVIRGILERFFILPSIPLAIAIGVGATFALAWLGVQLTDRVPRPTYAAGSPLLVGVVVVLAAALAGGRLSTVDRSDDRTAEYVGRDILEPLPPDALLLIRGDELFTSVSYVHRVLGVRSDVTTVDVELLKLSAEVQRLKREDPALVVPFAAYDDGVTASLRDVIAANLPLRPVFVMGTLNEDIASEYERLPEGLADRFEPASASPDKRASALLGSERARSLRVPQRRWPDSTWEYVIGTDYGEHFFELAVARQVPEPQSDHGELEAFYREAIRLAPYLEGAYKNLGLLLLDNGGDTAEVIRLWSTFLELAPDDDEAPAIRAEVERLKAASQ